MDREDPVVETGRMETEPVDRGVEAGRIRRNQWIGELSRPDSDREGMEVSEKMSG